MSSILALGELLQGMNSLCASRKADNDPCPAKQEPTIAFDWRVRLRNAFPTACMPGEVYPAN